MEELIEQTPDNDKKINIIPETDKRNYIGWAWAWAWVGTNNIGWASDYIKDDMLETNNTGS